MPRILLICSGNTCRSPMAEAILKSKAPDGDWEISSAGLFAAEGSPATREAGAALEEMGLNIGGHRSRRLTPSLAEAADLLIAMEGWQADELCARYPHCRGHIFTLAELAGGGNDVADPYGGDGERYRHTAEQLRELIDRAWGEIIEKVRSQTGI